MYAGEISRSLSVKLRQFSDVVEGIGIFGNTCGYEAEPHIRLEHKGLYN